MKRVMRAKRRVRLSAMPAFAAVGRLCDGTGARGREVAVELVVGVGIVGVGIIGVGIVSEVSVEDEVSGGIEIVNGTLEDDIEVCSSERVESTNGVLDIVGVGVVADAVLVPSLPVFSPPPPAPPVSLSTASHIPLMTLFASLLSSSLHTSPTHDSTTSNILPPLVSQ